MNSIYLYSNVKNLDTEALQTEFYQYLDSTGEGGVNENSAWDAEKTQHKKQRISRKRFRLYEEYAHLGDWLLSTEAIPLLLRVKPGSLKSGLFGNQHINDLAERLERHAQHDVPDRLNVVNSDDESPDWRIKPEDFIAWTDYLGVEAPLVLRAMVITQLVIPIAPLKFEVKCAPREAPFGAELAVLKGGGWMM